MESIKQIWINSSCARWRVRPFLAFLLVSMASIILPFIAKAQTFAEWFEQNKTQKKYLLQQIAALEVFSGYLKEGYQVASHGLGSISGSLKLENSLHTTYYSRLQSVDPAIKNNAMVKDILQWQQDILLQLEALDQLNGMSNEEKNYLQSVRAAVLKDCDDQLNSLQKVITDGTMEMSDAERISMIGKIHSAMMDNYRFASFFASQAEIYAAQRLQEKGQVLTEKQLYGIN